MSIAVVICVLVFSVWFTWSLYLAVMHLKTARNSGKLTTAAKVMGYPWLVVGYVIDVLFNAVIGSVIFFELPRELLFTSRVSRLNDSDGWRGRLARWVCTQLLDPFDPDGKHCQ